MRRQCPGRAGPAFEAGAELGFGAACSDAFAGLAACVDGEDAGVTALEATNRARRGSAPHGAWRPQHVPAGPDVRGLEAARSAPRPLALQSQCLLCGSVASGG